MNDDDHERDQGRRMPRRDPRAPRGRVLDARLHVLDRQVLDRDGVPVTTVDDLELEGIDLGVRIEPGSPPPKVAAILTGPQLLMRLFGGHAPASRRIAIPWRLVSAVGTTVRLGVGAASLDASWAERWVSRHLIGRIPGGRHDPE
jgi:sporulation protein YlmC with PRC-barrel domain